MRRKYTSFVHTWRHQGKFHQVAWTDIHFHPCNEANLDTFGSLVHIPIDKQIGMQLRQVSQSILGCKSTPFTNWNSIQFRPEASGVWKGLISYAQKFFWKAKFQSRKSLLAKLTDICCKSILGYLKPFITLAQSPSKKQAPDWIPQCNATQSPSTSPLANKGKREIKRNAVVLFMLAWIWIPKLWNISALIRNIRVHIDTKDPWPNKTRVLWKFQLLFSTDVFTVDDLPSGLRKWRTW